MTKYRLQAVLFVMVAFMLLQRVHDRGGLARH